MRSFPRFITLTLLTGLFSASGLYAQDNIIMKNGSEIPAKVLEVSPGQIKYRRQDNPDGPIYTTGTADVLLIKYANGTKDVLGRSVNRMPGRALASPNSVPQESGNSTGNQALGRLGYHSGLFSRYFTDGTGNRIDRSIAHSLIANESDALRAYRRGQSLRSWTYITAGSAVALIGVGAAVAALGDGGFGQDNNRRDGVSTKSTTTTDGLTDHGHRGDHGSAEVGVVLAGGGVLLGVAALILDHRATVQFRRAADRYNMHQQPATSLRVGPSQRGLGVGMTFTF